MDLGIDSCVGKYSLCDMCMRMTGFCDGVWSGLSVLDNRMIYAWIACTNMSSLISTRKKRREQVRAKM